MLWWYRSNGVHTILLLTRLGTGFLRFQNSGRAVQVMDDQWGLWGKGHVVGAGEGEEI